MKPNQSDLFRVGDVIAESIDRGFPAVVIAAFDIDGCWVVNCRSIRADGTGAHCGATHSFTQHDGVIATAAGRRWKTVGFCDHAPTMFADAKFDKVPNPVTVYILPYNKVFVAYEASRGFLSRDNAGDQYWQYFPAHSTWFNDPGLARVETARFFDKTGPEIGPVTFVNPKP